MGHISTGEDSVETSNRQRNALLQETLQANRMWFKISLLFIVAFAMCVSSVPAKKRRIEEVAEEGVVAKRRSEPKIPCNQHYLYDEEPEGFQCPHGKHCFVSTTKVGKYFTTTCM